MCLVKGQEKYVNKRRSTFSSFRGYLYPIFKLLGVYGGSWFVIVNSKRDFTEESLMGKMYCSVFLKRQESMLTREDIFFFHGYLYLIMKFWEYFALFSLFFVHSKFILLRKSLWGRYSAVSCERERKMLTNIFFRYYLYLIFEVMGVFSCGSFVIANFKCDYIEERFMGMMFCLVL